MVFLVVEMAVFSVDAHAPGRRKNEEEHSARLAYDEESAWAQ